MGVNLGLNHPPTLKNLVWVLRGAAHPWGWVDFGETSLAFGQRIWLWGVGFGARAMAHKFGSRFWVRGGSLNSATYHCRNPVSEGVGPRVSVKSYPGECWKLTLNMRNIPELISTMLLMEKNTQH